MTGSHDHTEARLLLAVLRERWNEADAVCDRDSPNGLLFVELTRRCNVQPWVHARLEASGRLAFLGDDVVEALTAARRKCRVDNLLLLAMLENALDRLLAAGVVPIVLKGVAVLQRFGIGFDERQLDDVDLLVREADFPRAFETLQDAGWTAPGEPERTHWLRSSFQMPMNSPGPVTVLFELHWGLGQRVRYDVETERLFERSRPLDIAGREVRRLDDHDAVAHLLLHHVQHYFDRRMKWALDMGRICREPGFEWDRVAERLSTWGGRGAAGMAVAHLRKLFPDLIPDRAAAILRPGWWRQALTAPLRSTHPLDMYRGTRGRRTQLYLAAVALEKPWMLPRYLLHRGVRDRRGTPLDCTTGVD